MMTFLTIDDYLPYIKADNLVVIHQNNPDLLKDLEKAAIEEIGSYTARHFDNNCLFTNVLTYDANVTYVKGEYVNINGKIYLAETDITPPHNQSDFKEEDPRSSLLKQMVINVVLYNIHARIAPNQIPTLRIERYKDTKQMLRDIANGLISGLPQDCRLTDEDGNVIFSWGSAKKIKQDW